MRVMRRRLVHLGAGRFHPFVQDGERARIGVDRHTERLRHAGGGDVTDGRPDPAGGEDIGAACRSTGAARGGALGDERDQVLLDSVAEAQS
jgi:hypothetical protein